MKNIDKSYESYKRKYNARRERYSEIFTKTEYKANYEIYTRRINDAVKSGEISKEEARSRKKSINAEMISDQTYEMSRKQASSIQKAIDDEAHRVGPLPSTYKLPTVRQVREGKNKIVNNFFARISSRYHELSNNGIASYDSSEIIGQEFFGSPK